MAGDPARPKQPSSAHFITYLLVGPHLYTCMTGHHTETKERTIRKHFLGHFGLWKNESDAETVQRPRATDHRPWRRHTCAFVIIRGKNQNRCCRLLARGPALCSIARKNISKKNRRPAHWPLKMA